MSTHSLLLNADYTPYKVVPWRRAVELLLDERADLIEDYVGQVVRSVSSSMPWPAVLRLRAFVKPRVRVRFNRQNVLARDSWVCAYCGIEPKRRDGRPRLEDLTLDHVIPRAQSRDGKVQAHRSVHSDRRKIPVTCWENVVTACSSCNSGKSDRTPEQAGLRLRIVPHAPTMTDVLRMSLRRVKVPDEWKEWLPEGAAEWGGIGSTEGDYWTVELDPD